MDIKDCINNFVCSVAAPTEDNSKYRIYCEKHKKCNIFIKIHKKARRISSHMKSYNKQHPELQTGVLKENVIRSLIINSLRSGFICPECKEIMKLNGRSTDNICSIDHIIPRWNGGTHNIENLRVICNKCDREKGIEERPIVM